MKKSVIVLLLVAMQCACSTQATVVPTTNTLIGYADIAAEITVGYQKVDDGDVPVPALTFSLIESP